MAIQVLWQLYIAWNGSTYVDESSRLLRANGEYALVAPQDGFTGGRGIISSMSLTLENTDGRYSPFNTSSAIYSSIQDGKAYHAPCYLNVSINNGTNYYRVFTGVIKYPQPSGATTKDISYIDIECRGMEERYLQNKQTTTLSDFQSYHDSNYDEATIIEDWLLNIGVSSGDIIFDSGLNTIPWAWLDDESPVEEAWKLAAACGGRFYANNDGDFVYESPTHWLTNTRSKTSQETIDTGDFERLEIEYDDKDLFSSVLVEASPREMIQPDTLWQPDETIVVPADSTRLLTIRLRQPAYIINDVTFSAQSAGGTDITSSVSITQTNYAQRIDLSITNAHTTHAAFLRPFSVTGRSVDGSATIEEERNSADHGTNGTYFSTRGSRQKSIRGNPYVQSRAQAATIAEYLMRQAEKPRITYRCFGVLGNPQRRLSDMVTLNDASLMSSSRSALISSVRWKLDGKGYKQDLILIDKTDLYPYQSTSPGYFVIGTNKLGSADASRGRLFF